MTRDGFVIAIKPPKFTYFANPRTLKPVKPWELSHLFVFSFDENKPKKKRKGGRRRGGKKARR